jgi:putative MATE family efflux protein
LVIEQDMSVESRVESQKPESASKSSWLWADLREGILGTQQDFTEGSLGRAIILLAIPMVLEMSMESLFAVVDVFYISQLGADAVATVGITESLLTLIYAVALGLSIATTALVARRMGEKQPDEAAIAAVQAIVLSLVVSLCVAFAGGMLAPNLFRLMGASEAIIENGTGYAVWMLGGNATIMLLFLNNAIFRGAGDAVIAMRALWLANIINIILDPCFIFGWGPFPQMGVTGAAVATNIGRGLGVCYQMYSLMRGKGRVTVQRHHWVLNARVMLRLLRVSLGGIFQFLIATASWLGLVRIIAIFGSAALAGYTIALRIIIFSILPSWGLSNAAATLVGQNLGAGKPERAEKSVWLTGLSNMLFLGCIAVVFITFPEPLIRLFTRDAAVVPVGVDCLRYVSYGYLFYAYGMVIVQAFNGAGDTDTPTIINLFCYWLFQIPLAYILAIRWGLGTRGVFLAITVAESLVAVVGMLVFRRGRWKQRRV